jgi:hypothetical protein
MRHSQGRPKDIPSGEWLTILRELHEGLTELGIKSDLFTSNRILINLWKAYERGDKKDPALAVAALDGNFEFVFGTERD